MPSKERYRQVRPTTAYLTSAQVEALRFLRERDGSGYSENIRRAIREYLLNQRLPAELSGKIRSELRGKEIH